MFEKVSKNLSINRITKETVIIIFGVRCRFGIIDRIPFDLSFGFNSPQQMERGYGILEKNSQNDFSQESLGTTVQTGSGVLIGNKPISEGSKNAIKIRSGELGKSGPGPRAKNDARKTGVADAWVQKPSNKSRPAASKRLGQQFQNGPTEGGNELFGRFFPRPSPDWRNPGCASGPRSIIILSQSKSSEQNSVREINTHHGRKGVFTDKSANTEPHIEDYKEIMSELECQSSRKKVEIEVGDQIYTIKNPYREDAYELGYKLADQIYDTIRECDTDVCDIAKNLAFKADNIKNVKDHVFYNKHYLDRLAPVEPVEYRRFDANIQQALAWKRLETGTHTQDDLTWIKHECAERHHELKYGSGYSEAHEQAQSRFDGAPWEDQF